MQVASSEVVRDINRGVVLNLIRTKQPISRADLARVSGLQRSTISLIVEELIEERWVLEGATGRLPRGRRPTFLWLNDDRMIIGVDINNDRKAWGERFGMTHFVNPKELGKDLVPHLVDMTKSGADQIGGADYTFDCTGNVTVMRQALESCHRGWGQSIVIGVAPSGAEIATRPFQLVTGRVWKGTAFGGARGRTDVPKIVDWYMQGKIQIDPMITHVMPLDQINHAFDLMHRGESIRSVVTF